MCAFLTSQGPATVAQLCDALQVGAVGCRMSLGRLRLAGAVRVGTVRGANVEVWEVIPPG